MIYKKFIRKFLCCIISIAFLLSFFIFMPLKANADASNGAVPDVKPLDDISINGLDYIKYMDTPISTSSMLTLSVGFVEKIPLSYIDMVIRIDDSMITEISVGSGVDERHKDLMFDLIKLDVYADIVYRYYRVYGYVYEGFSSDFFHFQILGDFYNPNLQFVSMRMFNTKINPMDVTVSGNIILGAQNHQVSGSSFRVSNNVDGAALLTSSLYLTGWRQFDYIVLDILVGYLGSDYMAGVHFAPNLSIAPFSFEEVYSGMYRLVVDLTNVDRLQDSNLVAFLNASLNSTDSAYFELISSYGFVLVEPPEPTVSWLRQIWNSIVNGFNSVIETLRNGFRSVVDAIENAFGGSDGGSDAGFDTSGSDFGSSSDEVAGAGAQLGDALGGGMSSLGSMTNSSAFTGTLTTLSAVSNAIFVGHEIEICGMKGNPFTLFVSLFSIAVLLPLGLKFIFRKWGSKGSGG